MGNYILLIFSLCAITSAATITSNVSRGNWNAGSSWSGGVVPSGTDDVIIRATDTVDVNIAVSLTGSVSSDLCSLTVNGYLKLGAQLNMNSYSALVVNAGAKIDLSGYDINGMTGGSYRRILVNGTANSKVKIYNSTGRGRVYYDDRNGNGSETDARISYCDFKSMGDINLLPWNTTDTVIIDHCTFTDCSRLYFGRWYNQAVVKVLYSDFYNSKNLASGTAIDIGSGESGKDSVLIRHCTFYHSSGAAIETEADGTVIDSCVFRNVNAMLLIDDYKFSNSAMFQSNCYDNSKLFGDAYKGERKNNYFWSDRDNPHWFVDASGIIDSNVIESTYGQGFGDAGDFIVSHGDDTLKIRHNIFIDGANGSFLNQVSGTSGGVVFVYNNTYFADMSKPTAPPFYGAIRNESGGILSGTISVFNNIFCNRSSSPANAAINIETVGDDQIDSTDFNNFYNVLDKYYQVVITGKTEGQEYFGASDKTIYPQFIDTSRCLYAWQVYISSSDAIATMLKLNGYNSVTSTQETPSAYTHIDLINYVKEGFVSHNALLNNSGKDGADIGALDVYTGPPPEISTLYDQTVKNGSIVTFTVTTTGSGTITYQWQKNETNISGATNATYFFTASKADHGATYRCIATNAGGSDTTNAATLSVSNVWPAGTKAVIPFTANKTLVGEAVPNFCYSVKIVTDARFKSAFNSAANITIFDTTTGLQRPARIWYYTKDTIFAIFDGPATNSIDKAFHACAGPTINRVNSAQAFTNSGISNFWGFDESAGSTTVSDYAGGSNGSVVSPATLGGGYLTSNGTGYVNPGILPNISNVSAVSAEVLVYIGGSIPIDLYVLRCRSGENGTYNHFQMRLTSTLVVVDIGKSSTVNEYGYGYVTHAGKINLNAWNLLQIVFDGSQGTNTTRLKLYINGTAYTLSFSGTIPPTLGVNTTTPLHLGGGVGVSGVERTASVCIGNIIGSAGCFQTRSAMLLQSDFWSQGASFGVGRVKIFPNNNFKSGFGIRNRRR